MALPELKSVKLTPAERKEEKAEINEYTPPPYPWGTRLCLDEDTIKKIGLDVTGLSAGSSQLVLVAKVDVTSVRSEQETNSKGGVETRRGVDLQITDMTLLPAEKAADAADVFYK